MTMLLLLLGKTLAVFAVSGLALLALRRASASARHLVCLLTLGAILALPLFSLTLPGWRLPVLRSEAAFQEPTQAQAPTFPKREGEEFGPVAEGVSDSSSSRFVRNPAKPLAAQQGGGFPTPPLSTVAGARGLLALYTLGVLLAALRPLLGLRGIAHLRCLYVPVTDPLMLAQSDDCAAVLRLSRPMSLCRADVPVPMTWGWHRPVVLLPSESTEWPEDRLRSVLLHEMAHIKRRDWLSHRFADIVCALYWFHPLAWLTARRLRTESEVACDDLVLTSGIAAPDYARHLLDIARTLPPVSRPAQTAIAMAQTSQIEERLKMILDKARSRRTLTRRVLIAAFAFGTVALVPLAMLKPTVKAQAVTNVSEIQTIGNISVHLAGVTSASQPSNRWWHLNGLLLPKAVYDTAAFDKGIGVFSPNTKNVTFAFFLPAALKNATVTFEAAGCSGSAWSGPRSVKAPGECTLAAEFPLAQRTSALRVGVASSPWTTVATSDGYGKSVSRDGQTFMFSPAVDTAQGVVLTVTTEGVKDDMRVVAVDKKGRELLSPPISEMGGSSISQTTSHFDLPLKRFQGFRIETRPFQWVEFKNVALQPVQ